MREKPPPIALTRDEIVLLLRAVNIASEDGSLSDDGNNAKDSALTDAVTAKLRAALTIQPSKTEKE